MSSERRREKGKRRTSRLIICLTAKRLGAMSVARLPSKWTKTSIGLCGEIVSENRRDESKGETNGSSLYDNCPSSPLSSTNETFVVIMVLTSRMRDLRSSFLTTCELTCLIRSSVRFEGGSKGGDVQA